MRSLSSLLLSSGGGALGGECPSSFALVVAPALPPPPILRLGLWWPAATQGRREPPSGLRSRCPSGSRAATARARRWRRPVLPRGVPAGLTSGSAARCRECCGGGSPHRRWPTTDPCGSRHLGIGSRRLILTAQAPARAWACRPAPPRRVGLRRDIGQLPAAGRRGPCRAGIPGVGRHHGGTGSASSWLTESAREIARGLVYALTHGAFALRSGTTCAAIPSCPSCPTCPSSIQAGDLSWLILAAFALGLLVGVGLTVGAAVIAQLTPSSTKPPVAVSPPSSDRRTDQLAIGGSAGLRAAVRLSQRADGGGQ